MADIFQQAKEQDSSNYLVSGSIAAGGAVGGYLATYPWAFREINYSKYPKLQSLRKIGEQEGFRVLSPSMDTAIKGAPAGANFWTKTKGRVGQLLFKSLSPVRSPLDLNRDYSGLLYVQSGEYSERTKPISPKLINWGNWDIGVSKASTWKYFQEKGISQYHAETLLASEFYEGIGSKAKLSKAGERFVSEAGGLENIVVKKADSALGVGVWTKGSELPSEVAEQMLRRPQEFLLQKKLDLAAEFRAITVGGKSVYQAHRFGTPGIRKFAEWARAKTGSSLLWNENTQPIASGTTRRGLSEFVEKVAAELPYEIGAFDVGLTKSGEFKIIEAQRQFGSITNPIVSRRIKNVLTGTKGNLGIATAAIGAGIGLSVYSLIADNQIVSKIPGSDDAYNTIEGMNEKGLAARLRKENTEFGSGWAWKLPQRIIKAGSNWGKKIVSDPEVRLATGVPLLMGMGVGLFDTSSGVGAGLGAAAGAELGYFSGGIKGGYKGAFLGAIAGVGADFVADSLGGGIGSAFAIGIGASVASSISMAALMKGGLGLRSQLRETLATLTEISGDKLPGTVDEIITGFESKLGARGLSFSLKKDIPEAFRKAEAWQKAKEAQKLGLKEYDIAWEKHLNIEPPTEILQDANLRRKFYQRQRERAPKREDFFEHAVSPMEESPDIAGVLGTIIGLKPWAQKLDFIGKAAEKFPKAAHFFDAAIGSPALGDVAEKYGELGLAPSKEIFKAIGQDILEGVPIGIGTASIGYFVSPKENRATNAFDGMQHGGLAQDIRHEMTYFGSKFDTVRALADSLGMTFEMLTKRKGFQSALKNAEEVRVLGQGRWGRATLHRTTYKGETFEFVRKKVKPGAKEEFLEDVKFFGGMDEVNLAANLKSLDLRAETRTMKALDTATSEIIPSPYGVIDNAMYMEHMPGIPVKDLAEQGIAPSILQQQKLVEGVKDIAARGIEHVDLNTGNILIDQVSGRASIVDFGLTQALTTTSEKSMGALQMGSRIESAFKSVKLENKKYSLALAKTPIKRHVNINNAELADTLRMQQRQIWENGRSGGKRHIGYAGDHVSHPNSKLSGGI